MNDEKKTDVESCGNCGCGSSDGGCGDSGESKYIWIWTLLALALALAAFGMFAGKKGPSACAGGFCPLPEAAAESDTAPAPMK